MITSISSSTAEEQLVVHAVHLIIYICPLAFPPLSLSARFWRSHCPFEMHMFAEFQPSEHSLHSNAPERFDGSETQRTLAAALGAISICGRGGLLRIRILQQHSLRRAQRPPGDEASQWMCPLYRWDL